MAWNITILFTDLVGSTATASRVGPERAEQLRVEHFRLFRAAIRPHLGREVKNVGDGMMVVFSSVSAAIGAATSLQQVFDARNRDAPSGERFDLRVGVAAGDAFEEMVGAGWDSTPSAFAASAAQSVETANFI